MSLYDIFPDSLKEQFNASNVKEGFVLNVELKGQHQANKRKILVLLDSKDETKIGFVFINTSVRQKFQVRQKL